MDKKTFTAMVFRVRPPGMGEDSLNEAIDYFINVLGQTQQSDVSHCIQLADRFAVSFASPRGDAGMSGRRLEPLTPGIIVISNDLTQRITSSVEQVREEVFGSTDVPFSSYEQVAAWLEETGQHQAYTSHYEERAVNGYSIGGPTWVVQDPQLDQQLQAIQQQIRALYRQWEELTGEAVESSDPPKCRYLPYVRPGALGGVYVEHFPACAGSPLAKLCEISHTLAEVTGFSQPSIVMYILMGKEPLLLSPFTVRFERKPYPTFDRVRVRATLEIETPDITDIQWRAIHQEIRQAWGVENTTQLDDDDQRLQNIVEQLGGVPQGQGKMAFWEKVCQEWNRQELQKAELKQQQGYTYTPNRHKNGKTTRVRYDRLIKKLATQVSGAEKQWSPTMILQEVTSWDGIRSRRTHLRQLSNNKIQK